MPVLETGIGDQPVANVACSATVRSDGFHRTTELLVESFFNYVLLPRADT